MISISNLHAEVMARQSKRFAIYEEVFHKVISKIKYENTKTDTCSCVYTLPVWVFGVPLYNLPACVDYIIRRLKENFFQVIFKYPNILYISWQQRPATTNNQLTYSNLNPGTMTLHDIQETKQIVQNPSKKKQNIFAEIDKTFLEKSSDIIKPPLNNSELNARIMRPASYALSVDDFKAPAPDLDDVLMALDNM